MSLIKKSLVLGLFLLSAVFVFSQQFGGNPPSLRWNQINTDSVRIIFPIGLQAKAASIAGLAGKLGVNQSTLGNRFQKISIVLQNQTTFSNGYVGLGPRRSEFYLNPLQNSFELGSLPWHEQLALHEFRHIQQYNNFNKGISKLLYVLAGELGLSFANSTAIPDWFWEGDAVFQETQLSKQGRGRLPYFFNGYRSLWAAKKEYSWMKLRNGSLRDYVPNHYQLGYLFVSYGREKYGDSIWAKITNDAARFKPLFYPFQGALKKHTGIKYSNFTKEAMGFFRSQLADFEDTANNLARKQRHFTGDIEFPQWVDNNRLIYVSSSYKKIPRFIIKDTETKIETAIRVKDISLDNYFSVKKNLLVYSAVGFDARWGWRDYSEIRLLDISTGKQEKITRKTKLFSPDISENGNEIVAIEQNPNGSSAIVVLNLYGETIQRLEIAPNQVYTYPKFFGSDKIVCAIRNEQGEMTLAIVDRKTGKTASILPYSMNVIGFPTVENETIYFTASEGEQDQLFAYSNGILKVFKPSRLYNHSTGSYALSVQKSKAAWTNFTATGSSLTTTDITPNDFEPLNFPDIKPLPTFGVNGLVDSNSILGVSQEHPYPIKHYSKGYRLVNFHSWLPNFADPDYTLSFISENVLNTLQSEVYFNYNRSEESKKIGFVGAYGALYPWIRAGAAFTKDRRFPYGGNQVYWDEFESRIGVLVPLNFSGGRSFRSLRLGTDYVLIKPDYKGLYKDTFDNRLYGYLNSYITFTNQIQKARQHIFPRFAQTLRIDYNHGISNISGKQILINGLFYFPGIHVNHSLVLNAAWQRKDTMNQIRFQNNFPISRGYFGTNFSSQVKFGANYHLPLFYPDRGLANIVYFLRVRANLFYDYSFVEGFNQQRQRVSGELRSFGGEVFFDTKWWNQQPISFGIRYSRLLDAARQGLEPNQFEFVLPVNLINR